jgi:thioredoxin-related protein
MTRAITNRRRLNPQACRAAALAAACLLASAARGDGVPWRHDYNAARREAHDAGRPLLLDFGTEQCYWCRRLDETTFVDPAVQRLLSEHFVPVKVDGNRSPYLAQVLQVQVYPTLVLAAPDGKILLTLEGYQDAPRMADHLRRTLALAQGPEAMTRDYEEAVRALHASDRTRAVALLKRITEDGKDRPVQLKARQLLRELDPPAAVRLEGVQPAQVAAASPEERSRRARELLTRAREELSSGQYLKCLDCCEAVTAACPDLPEGAEAARLLAEVKDNPEWVRQACESLGDRLGNLYLALAESCLAKGQTRKAAESLERVVQAAPASRAAETARRHLANLQGAALKP